MAKILVAGLPASGKTTLLKSLKESTSDIFVFSRDGKKFPLVFQLPHRNLQPFDTVSSVIPYVEGQPVKETLLDQVKDGLKVFKERNGKYPDTVVFDTVSRIQTELLNSCNTWFSGFNVYSNLNKEINDFNAMIAMLESRGMNVILITHAIYNGDTGLFEEVSKGEFAKIGGFLSTVDYSIFIESKNNTRHVYHRNYGLSRTLIDSLPDKQPVEEFSLQEYIDLINNTSDENSDNYSY